MNTSVFDIFNILGVITWNDEMPHTNPLHFCPVSQPNPEQAGPYVRSEHLRNLTKPWQPQFSARGAATSVIRAVPHIPWSVISPVLMQSRALLSARSEDEQAVSMA